MGHAGAAPLLSRQQRLRNATISEIKQVARALLVRHGPSKVTIRAIAREMGMTAPAVYRYFGSHEELIQALRMDIFADAADFIRAEAEAVPDGAEADVIPRQLIAASRGLRRWALDHPQEFGMIPAKPVHFDAPDSPDAAADWIFASVFAHRVARLWHVREFPAPPTEQLPEGLVRQLERVRDLRGIDLPTEGVAVMLQCWVRLYGAVCMEATGHLKFVADDAQPFFERELADLCAMLGAADAYTPPLCPAKESG